MQAERMGRQHVRRGAGLPDHIPHVAEDPRKHDRRNRRRRCGADVDAGQRDQSCRGTQERSGHERSQGLVDAAVRQLQHGHGRQRQHPGQTQSRHDGPQDSARGVRRAVPSPAGRWNAKFRNRLATTVAGIARSSGGYCCAPRPAARSPASCCCPGAHRAYAHPCRSPAPSEPASRPAVRKSTGPPGRPQSAKSNRGTGSNTRRAADISAGLPGAGRAGAPRGRSVPTVAGIVGEPGAAEKYVSSRRRPAVLDCRSGPTRYRTGWLSTARHERRCGLPR